jgi:acyl-coenzyme A thioesterase PaaI-like protein
MDTGTGSEDQVDHPPAAPTLSDGEVAAATATVDSAHTSEARLALAATLRRLGNALVAHQPDDALLAEIARQVDGLVPRVEAAPQRPHAFLEHGPAIFSRAVAEGTAVVPRNAFPDCVVSGRANPMGIAAQLWREEDEAVCRVTLGEAFEGAPGRAHGGVVAALIDETMGLVMSISATPAFTGRLAVTYRAPTPLGQPLEVRARLAGRAGRKITVTSELRSAQRLLAQGEGVFIAVEPEHFFASEG